MEMTPTMITNIYVKAYTKVRESGGTKSDAIKVGAKAIRDAGYFLDKGKWKKAKPSQKNTKAFTNRSDENKKLAKVKIKSSMGMA